VKNKILSEDVNQQEENQGLNNNVKKDEMFFSNTI
jgi:hypothetical protein